MVARQRWPAEAPRLAGLVFDSPLVDLRAVVRSRARNGGVVPAGLAAEAGLALAARRVRVDFSALDLRRLAPTLDVPTLLIGAVRDSTVPIELVDAFAAAAPADRTEYWRVDDAEHVEAYNVAPEEYERRVAALLDRAFGNAPFSGPRSV
jgi:uncharacterized protein